MKLKPMRTLCVCLMLIGNSADAKNYVIALSQMQKPETLQQQSEATLQFFLEHVKPGESALVVDGLNLKTIALFRVRNKKAYDHPRAKLRSNQKAVAALRNFAEHPVEIAEHGIAGVMQVPQLLQFLGENYGPFKTTTEIILLASPLYVDARDPNWGMINNQFPGDGHFNVVPQLSPFSLHGRQGLLKNTRIHWDFLDRSWMSSEYYSVSVTRVWHILTTGYGSKLSTFTSDQSVVWNRALAGASPAPHEYKFDTVEKVETIQVVDDKQDTSRKSIYERALTDTPPTQKIIRQAQNVEIGISWHCQHCDLDLYVRPRHGADILYFNHRETDEGYYHKDFRHSPKTDGGFETVTLTSTVDLRDVLIAINWYRGESQEGITGEIRLAISDQTYGLPFSFPGKDGNNSIGRDETLETNQPANDGWLIINPENIVGM